MNFTSRVLIGTLALTAAASGGAMRAHASDGAGGSLDDAASADATRLLCPLVTSGPLSEVLAKLNPQSVAEACVSVAPSAAPGPAPAPPGA